jgi:hypothetical protein
MKHINRILTASFIVTSFFLSACQNNPKPTTPEMVGPTSEQLIQKGEYLVTIMGCNDCHSPKEMGPQGPVVIKGLMLSGYPESRPL